MWMSNWWMYTSILLHKTFITYILIQIHPNNSSNAKWLQHDHRIICVYSWPLWPHLLDITVNPKFPCVLITVNGSKGSQNNYVMTAICSLNSYFIKSGHKQTFKLLVFWREFIQGYTNLVQNKVKLGSTDKHIFNSVAYFPLSSLKVLTYCILEKIEKLTNFPVMENKLKKREKVKYPGKLFQHSPIFLQPRIN